MVIFKKGFIPKTNIGKFFMGDNGIVEWADFLSPVYTIYVGTYLWMKYLGVDITVLELMCLILGSLGHGFINRNEGFKSLTNTIKKETDEESFEVAKEPSDH